MKDLVTMWREPRMVVLTGVCAAVYAAAMIPFKALIIFPGLAEVRPAAVLPVVFSLMFGPAGAVGSGFGNVVGDMLGGMLGPGSIFGFLANFAYGYVPYKLWEAWGGSRDMKEIESWNNRVPAWARSGRDIGLILAGAFALSIALTYIGHLAGFYDLSKAISWKEGEATVYAGFAISLLVYALFVALLIVSVVLLLFSPKKLVAIILVASAACGAVIGWGVDILGFLPFKVLGVWILVNNFAVSFILGPPLILLLYPRVSGRFMLYTDLMGEREARPARERLGSVFVILGCVLVYAVGVFGGDAGFLVSNNLDMGFALSPFILLLFVGLFLL